MTSIVRNGVHEYIGRTMSNPPTASNPMAGVLRDLTPMDPTEALRRLQVLVQSEPNLRAITDDHSCPPETLKWLGELHAVVSAMKDANRNRCPVIGPLVRSSTDRFYCPQPRRGGVAGAGGSVVTRDHMNIEDMKASWGKPQKLHALHSSCVPRDLTA